MGEQHSMQESEGREPKVRLHPYLNFNGNCEEAFKFYHSVFGGPAPTYLRFKDMPKDELPQVAEEEQNQILHVSYKISEAQILMGSDSPAEFGPVVAGNNMHISIDLDSASAGEQLFAALSAGGQIIMPFEKVFWGGLFGMFTDRFAINWMLSAPLAATD